MMLSRWRARRDIKPLLEEIEADSEQVGRGTDEWLRWWRGGGERELQCILMTAWDPIGVSDAVEAWDEYNGYAPGVAHRLRDATDPDKAAEQVTEYLNHIEHDYMGNLTNERRKANGYLAEALVAWYEWSFEQDGRAPR
jgi:hypothetical protein